MTSTSSPRQRLPQSTPLSRPSSTRRSSGTGSAPCVGSSRISGCRRPARAPARGLPDARQPAPHRLAGEGAGLPGGLARRQAPCEERGERGGMRAAGAVVGLAGEALADDRPDACRVGVPVHAVRVAARHDHRERPERQNCRRELLTACAGHLREHARFLEVGRRHRRARQQQRAQRVLGIGREQARTARGDHHRVDHDRAPQRRELERHGGHQRGAREHAGLGRVHADVGPQRGSARARSRGHVVHRLTPRCSGR